MGDFRRATNNDSHRQPRGSSVGTALAASFMRLGFSCRRSYAPHCGAKVAVPYALSFQDMESGSDASPACRVKAPRAASGRSEKQKDETVQHGRLALIQRRREEVSLRDVPDEVGRGHFPREDECRRPREQTSDEQHAADELEDAGKPDQRQEIQIVEIGDMRNSEELRSGVLQKQESRHDAQGALRSRRPCIQKSFRREHVSSYGRSMPQYRPT